MCHRHPGRQLLLLFLLLLGQGAARAQVLVADDFEGGPTAAWSPAIGTTQTVCYGSVGGVASAVATEIGGLNEYLSDDSGGAAIEQSVSLSGLAGCVVRASGYFGGTQAGAARLVLRFIDGNGTVRVVETLEWVTALSRNFEDVLALREDHFDVEPGDAMLEVRLEFGGTGATGAVDRICVEAIPPPTPNGFGMNNDMMENGGFELGWNGVSPLDLNEAQRWELVAGTTPVAVTSYGPNVGTPAVPTVNMSGVIAGGGSFLQDGGGNVLRQPIDVSDDQGLIAGGVSLRVEAYLGARLASADEAGIELSFLDSDGVTLGGPEKVGPVTRAQRNWHSTVIRRSGEFPVPIGTAQVDVDIVFTDDPGNPGGAYGYVDNVSLEFVAPSTPPGIATGVNLIRNGQFSDGSFTTTDPLTLTPLEIDALDGWDGAGSNTVVKTYGQPLVSGGSLPPLSFAMTHNLGTELLKDLGGNGRLRQSFAFDATELGVVAQGNYAFCAGAWLGGVGTENDTAEVAITCFDAGGMSAGSWTLGPVEAAERCYQTGLVEKQLSNIPIPIDTVFIEVEVIFTDNGAAPAVGLADGVEFLIHPLGLTRPGTSEGLRLRSGVNGPVSTGAPNDVVDAIHLDVLTLVVDSPDGMFDSVPLIFAADVFPTASPPTPLFGGQPIWMSASLILLADGPNCPLLPFCPFVLPGGTTFNYLVPDLPATSILFQAFVISGSAMNGTWAASEAHEIRIM